MRVAARHARLVAGKALVLVSSCFVNVHLYRRPLLCMYATASGCGPLSLCLLLPTAVRTRAARTIRRHISTHAILPPLLLLFACRYAARRRYLLSSSSLPISAVGRFTGRCVGAGRSAWHFTNIRCAGRQRGGGTAQNKRRGTPFRHLQQRGVTTLRVTRRRLRICARRCVTPGWLRRLDRTGEYNGSIWLLPTRWLYGATALDFATTSLLPAALCPATATCSAFLPHPPGGGGR